MSVKNENAAAGDSVVLERPAAGGCTRRCLKKSILARCLN